MSSATDEYSLFHRRRFQFLLERVEELRRAQSPRAEQPWRILDVGASYQTQMLRERYPNAVIDTLGFEDHRFPPRPQERFIAFDLNQAANLEAVPVVEPHDVVVLAEVIEHLYVAPTSLLRCVSGWLRPGGSVIIQTPNPVSLGKRARMLRGVSPFEVIREDRFNPGHFCEYTIADLRAIAARAGFEVSGWWLRNYFGPAGVKNRIYSAIATLLPGQLDDGITIVLRKPYPVIADRS